MPRSQEELACLEAIADALGVRAADLAWVQNWESMIGRRPNPENPGTTSAGVPYRETARRSSAPACGTPPRMS